jgi:hypothetical protein
VVKPPPLVLLAYRFLGWRVGPTYADWVHDDITSRGWIIRQGAPALSAALLAGGLITAAFGGDAEKLTRLVVLLALGGLALRKPLRDRALLTQGLNADGGVLPAATWYADDGQRLRRNLMSVTATVLLVVGGFTILAYRTR